MSAAPIALVTALVTTLVSGCVADELDDVRAVRVQTHVEDWRDEIIYQLVVDRFANGQPGNDFRVSRAPFALARYKGGDWQGVIDRLDYLEALGITAIWISPIILNVDTDAGIDGYHGYWAIDLERLNPHFGDLAVLRRMVDAAHDRGIKVVLDIVTNHLGQAFYYDMNMNGRPDEGSSGGFPETPGNPQGGTRSPTWHVTEYDPDYAPGGIRAFTSLGDAGPAPIYFFDMPEIFRTPPNPPIFQDPLSYNRRGRVIDWNDREQVVYGDFPGGLKDVNTLRPEVQAEMVRVYTDWVLAADLDGFRIDTLKHVEHEFWQVFARGVRERLAAAGKENFLMFGEAFDGDDVLVGSYTAPGEMDSVFYFPQKFQVFDDVFARGGPTANVQRLHEQRDANYSSEPQPGGIGVPPTQALVNFIDNHDVPRFLFTNPDPRALRAALAYLLTEDGIPCIYYGTEQDYFGGNDPSNREPLWWSGYDTTGETFRFIARMTRMRLRYRALTRGDFTIRWATDRTGDAADAGILAFERATADGQQAIVVINAQGAHDSTTAHEDAAMEVGVPGGSVLVDALTGDRHTVGADRTMRLTVPPFGAMILIPESQFVPE